MNMDEYKGETPARFALREAREARQRKEARAAGRLAIGEINEQVIPVGWKIAIVAFLCVCMYFVSIDILLLIWGKSTTGVVSREIPYSYTKAGCHTVYYNFSDDSGIQHEVSVCYQCGRGSRGYGPITCIGVRDKIEVDYVSWNPSINRAFYNLLDKPR